MSDAYLAPVRPAADVGVPDEGADGGVAAEMDAAEAARAHPVEDLEGGGSADEELHPAEEARAARPARDPGAPTAAMIEAHASTHLPYRSWCPDCVQGRRDNAAHKAIGAGVLEVPEVCFDYAFVRRQGEEECITILVMRDRGTRALRVWVVPEKGPSLEDSVTKAAEGVMQLGYRGRVLIKCDNEPAMTAFRAALMTKLPEGAIPIAPPAGESASNGVVENAVKVAKGLMRVHLGALERKVGARFPGEHPVIAWLAEFVGDSCTKYLQGVDGKTAYERLYGKQVREEALEFGEIVLFRPKKLADADVLLESRWARGVWLGRRWGSPISRVFSRGEVVDVRAIQRVPAAERWCAATLGAIRATPWCVRPVPEADAAPLVVLPPLPDAAAPPPLEPLGYIPRRVFITRADLETWGYTAGCRRCTMVREGSRAQGVAHREACRARIEQCLREAGDPRVGRAEERRIAAADAAAATGATAAVVAPPVQVAAAPHPEIVAPAAAAVGGPAAPPPTPTLLPPPPALEADWSDLVRRLQARRAAASAVAPAPLMPAAAESAARAGSEGEMDDAADNTVTLSDGMLVGRAAMGELAESDLIDGDGIESAPEWVKAEATTLMELFMVYGVDHETAKAKVVELYSPPRVTKEMRRVRTMCLAAGSTFDLIADTSGKVWNFLLAEDRARCRTQLAKEKPYLVIGNPPCTQYSRLQSLNRDRVDPKERHRKQVEAKVLLDFAVEVYWSQLARGAHFLHEHPLAATSWDEPAVKELRSHSQVFEISAHQCCFGLAARDPSGLMQPVLKPTRFLSSAPLLLKELARRCSGEHSHTRLLGGCRAAAAALYPPGLCRAILRGIARQYRLDGKVVPAGVGRACRHGSSVVDLSESSLAAVQRTPTVERVEVEGAPSRVEDEGAAPEFWDEISGEALPTHLVQASRAEELKFMSDWEVWEEAPVAECHQVTGRKPLGGRWVDVNKGDARAPVVRCRYVAKDFANGKSDEYFAATPPLEALRFLLAHVAGKSGADSLLVVDARKAHLHAHVDRPIYVDLPPELARPGWCARLKRCLYGTRDAPKRWEAYVAEVMRSLGFRRGKASPCCFFHPARGLRCVVHGDDFVLAGAPQELVWFKQAVVIPF